MGKLALVLSAGGARGAYEAGVIHYIRTGLPAEYARKSFEVLSGSSAGAINTIAMAALAEDPSHQGKLIHDLWCSLSAENIFRRDLGAAGQFFVSSFKGILRNLTKLNPFHLGKSSGPHLNYFLDTRPLWQYLRKHVPWEQLGKNIKRGDVEAICITATNTRSGRVELFIQKKKEIEYTGPYRHHEVELGVEHVMASAAIPIIFPTVKINHVYYTDGGLRLFTPLSPAIQLGADRAIVIGLRHKPTLKEIEAYDSQDMKSPPSVVELAGRIMNGVFLDHIQYDLEQTERINRIIDYSEKIYGSDYLEKLNKHLENHAPHLHPNPRGFHKIQTAEVWPSEFISKIFARWFHKVDKGTYKLSTLEKLLTRMLDVDAEGAVELLSYLTFAPDYLKELVDLGYEDAKKHRDALMQIMASP